MSLPGRLAPLAASLAMIVAACGGSETGPPITSAAYLGFRAQPTACAAERPDTAVEMLFAAPEDMGVTEVTEVVLTTSCGDIRLALYPDVAPTAVNSFLFLAKQGYYDGTALHRVVPGFIVQFGDPNAGGGGGAPGYRLPDELPPAEYVYPQGVVAMANAGPNTAGSQFFITVREVGLPPSYTVFGSVISGFDTIVRITEVALGSNPNFGENSRPLESVYIDHVEVIGR